MLADRVDGLTLLKNTRILEGDRSADVASYGRGVAPEIQEQLLFLPPSALTVCSNAIFVRWRAWRTGKGKLR